MPECFLESDVEVAKIKLEKRGIRLDDPNYEWYLKQELANAPVVNLTSQYEGIDSKKMEEKFIRRPDIDD